MSTTRRAGVGGRTGSVLVRVLLALLALALLVAGAVVLLHEKHEQDTAPRDMDGRPVQVEDLALPGSSTLQRMDVRSSGDEAGSDGRATGGERLRVPSVDLDVGIGSLNMVDGEITPPGFTEAYRVRNVGHERAYLVTHSIHAGTAPGNYLTRVHDGDVVDVGDDEYTVTSTEKISKSALPGREDIWTDTPDTLVIITCQQRASGPSLENFVITAQKRSTAGKHATQG